MFFVSSTTNYLNDKKAEKMKDYIFCNRQCPRDYELIDGNLVTDYEKKLEATKCWATCQKEYGITLDEYFKWKNSGDNIYLPF